MSGYQFKRNHSIGTLLNCKVSTNELIRFIYVFWYLFHLELVMTNEVVNNLKTEYNCTIRTK